MKIAAIIPVKTFSNAKTRIKLNSEKKEHLCKIMLKEVLKTIFDSKLIDNIVLVSKDEDALAIGKEFRSVQIYDEKESGVNNAVSLADSYLEKNVYDASIVFPQDIPLVQSQDIQNLLGFQHSQNSILIVPSRKFDGTNALFRSPVKIMATHYDEDSYKIHLQVGRLITKNTSLVLIRRLMFDIDDQNDLNMVLAQNEKPQFCKKILDTFSNS